MAVYKTMAPVYTTLGNASTQNGGTFTSGGMDNNDTISDQAESWIPFPLPNDTPNLSKACEPAKIKFEVQYRAYRKNYTAVDVHFETTCFVNSPNANPNLFQVAGYEQFGIRNASESNYASATIERNVPQIQAVESIGLKFKFWRDDVWSWGGNVSAEIKQLKIGYTRTRACFIAFNDDTRYKRKVYDYGAIPSYGSVPTKEGYTFVGWKSSLDGKTYTTLPAAGEVDVTYTAVFEKIKSTITAIVSPESSGTVIGGGTYDYGTSVQLSAQPAEGYRFVKWSDGVTTATRTVSVGAGDVTYTAVFEQKTYTVRYFPSDGWSNIPEAQTKQHGVDIRISSKIPTKEGYTFNCWRHDNKDYFPNDIYSLNEDILLVIVSIEWYYYVQYDANGGTNIPSAQTKYYFTDLTLSSNIPTRTGYTFLYWTTNQDGTGTKYNPGDTFTTNVATTLYAQWKRIQIDSAALTYNGAQISSTNKVPAGQSFLISVGVSEVYS